MKMTTKSGGLALMAACCASFLPLSLLAQTSNTTSVHVSGDVATPVPLILAGPQEPGTKLPYGVEDVLKLSRANVGEEIILNYVRGSGTIYNLGAKEIVYLRDQGVTEKVINAMLDQRKRAEVAMQPAPVTPVQPTEGAVAPMNADVMSPNGMAAPVDTDPNATYAQAPLTPPASSAYVIPYSPSYYAPYGYYYPYYGGWYGPSVAFGFSYGVHGHYGGGHYVNHFGSHASGGHSGGGHGGHH
jgi:hypothetical protein